MWDTELVRYLSNDIKEQVKLNVEKKILQEEYTVTELQAKQNLLLHLKDEFISLQSQENRQEAGFKLEEILNSLFDIEDLHPSQSFRVNGEQIDGAFVLDNETYIVEAKWTKKKSDISDLYTFKTKIEGKSQFTRGVFISINGISEQANEAITKGKQPNFFVLDGYDLFNVLDGQILLKKVLRGKYRMLTEKGYVYAPFNSVFF